MMHYLRAKDGSNIYIYVPSKVCILHVVCSTYMCTFRPSGTFLRYMIHVEGMHTNKKCG